MAFINRIFTLLFRGSNEDITLFSPQRRLAQPEDQRVAIRQPLSLSSIGDVVHSTEDHVEGTVGDVQDTLDDVKDTVTDVKDGNLKDLTKDGKDLVDDAKNTLTDPEGVSGLAANAANVKFSPVGSDQHDGDGGKPHQSPSSSTNSSPEHTNTPPPPSNTNDPPNHSSSNHDNGNNHRNGNSNGPGDDNHSDDNSHGDRASGTVVTPTGNTGHNEGSTSTTQPLSPSNGALSAPSSSGTGVVTKDGLSSDNNVLVAGGDPTLLPSSATDSGIVIPKTLTLTDSSHTFVTTSYSTYHGIPSSASSPSSPAKSSGASPPAALIGGVVAGVILLLTILSIFLVRLLRKRRAVRASKNASTYPFVGSNAAMSSSDIEGSTWSSSPTVRSKRVLSYIRNLFPSAGRRSVFRYVPDPFLSASRRSSASFLPISRWSSRSSTASLQTASDLDDREKQVVSRASSFHTAVDHDPEKYILA